MPCPAISTPDRPSVQEPASCAVLPSSVPEAQSWRLASPTTARPSHRLLPGVAAAYGHYPEGGRAWKQVNGVTSPYLEVGGLEWAQLDASGTIRQRYIRSGGADGAVIATRDAAGLTWGHSAGCSVNNAEAERGENVMPPDAS